MSESEASVPQRPPNIIMILTDDHAAHAVGAYGSVVNRTPRIDEIGALGVRFDHCFAANALCAPSRASILTGTHSHVNGVTTVFARFDAAQPTFVSLLSEAGYRTAIVGKWHLGHGHQHDPRHFDYWDVLHKQGTYFDPVFHSADGTRQESGYVTDIITDLALAWADQQDDDQPWCLLIHHKAPHRSWQPDALHAGMYTDPIPVPSTFTDDHATRSRSARRAAMSIAAHLTAEDLKQDPPPGLDDAELALWKYQRYMEDYLACVASVDDNVGRVVDWLLERDQLDDTLLMYTSDQGFFLGDHGWFDKRFMYEESLRMPLMLSYPRRVPAGQVNTGIVTNVDFAQTILDAAGVKHHARMQGRSFFGDVTGAASASPPVTGMYYRYWEHDDADHQAPAHYGYRTDQYKIIYFYNDGLGLPGTGDRVYPGDWELYDLLADPKELRNVYHDPGYVAIREQMKELLRRAQAELGDRPHAGEPGANDGGHVSVRRLGTGGAVPR